MPIPDWFLAPIKTIGRCNTPLSMLVIGMIVDTDSLESDLQNGWYLDSDVPIGYGLGSSGMVVAAVYDRYARNRSQDAMFLKTLFARMEGNFHGSSSGVDPLQCYLGKPFKITSEGLELFDDGFLHSGIQICLIDTNIKSNTKPLVEYFKRQREDDAFLTGFQNDYLPYVTGCIDTMIQGDVDGFFAMLQGLTLAQRRFFEPMIPKSTTELFESTYDFRFGVKILGSGGGGYILGFTDDWHKAASVLQGRDVLWL
ncbi:MAG: hypothetical protein IKG18_05125 [Atopobiaceae bacterium]|nr:hypothetical protein [Atopobiaceae bacterium]